ncbi:glycosyltransferase family 4 protein [Desulfoplanes sp.]
MKILQINTEKTWRGGEKQTLLTAKRLGALGARVELLCRKGYPLAQKAKAMGITCREVQGSLHALAVLALHGTSYDILHAQTAKGQGLAVLTKFLHRSKIVYTRRVDFVPRGVPARFKFNHTDKVVAISGAVADVLENFGAKTDLVIPSAIDLDSPSPSFSTSLRNEILGHKRDGKKIILTIAALVPHKDPFTMVNAIKRLHQMAPDSIFYHCGSGDLEDEIRHMVHESGSRDFYRLLGFVDHAEGILPLADVFVMSSQEEGLGSTVLEAFRHKIPVATTDAGGLEEIVPGHGLVSPVHDHHALAENIHRLLTDPEETKILTEKACAYVHSNHSDAAMASRYLSLFDSMTRNKKNGPHSH